MLPAAKAHGPTSTGIALVPKLGLGNALGCEAQLRRTLNAGKHSFQDNVIPKLELRNEGKPKYFSALVPKLRLGNALVFRSSSFDEGAPLRSTASKTTSFPSRSLGTRG